VVGEQRIARAVRAPKREYFRYISVRIEPEPHVRGRTGKLLNFPSRAYRDGFWFVWAFLAFPSLALFGQSLRLSPEAGSPGEQVSVNLYLTSPHGQEQPSTLQWEISIPMAQLGLLDESPAPGPTAQAVGKSVSCRVKTTTATTQTSICILYGGREPIHDGVVAVLRLKIAPDARLGSARVRIDQGLAVLKDLTKIAIKPTDGVGKLRQK